MFKLTSSALLAVSAATALGCEKDSEAAISPLEASEIGVEVAVRGHYASCDDVLIRIPARQFGRPLDRALLYLGPYPEYDVAVVLDFVEDPMDASRMLTQLCLSEERLEQSSLKASYSRRDNLCASPSIFLANLPRYASRVEKGDSGNEE